MEEIKVTCYGKTETWSDRKKAMAFYGEGMLNSDGSEQERYTKIYMELLRGLNNCTDEGED